jgi:hypothetical protein
MRRIIRSRPSPTMLVAVLALVAALAGTAVAGPTATTSVSKKKVKKIAKKQAIKQINELAPELSVANADTVGGQQPSAFAPSAPEPFRRVGAPGQPQFQNNWDNLGGGTSTAAFYKDPWDVVHLKGFLDTGTGSDGRTAFTLPPGYRPSELLVMFNGCGVFTITPNGPVTPDCEDVSGQYSIPMDGLTFRVP